jgi:hypothetical protein
MFLCGFGGTGVDSEQARSSVSSVAGLEDRECEQGRVTRNGVDEGRHCVRATRQR